MTDSQQVEIIGQGVLMAHLIDGGVEVAGPERRLALWAGLAARSGSSTSAVGTG
jgi:hypothetical protein